MAHAIRKVIFTGEGNGKTTAAFGMALRALGNDLRVRIVQFVKAAPSGEIRAISALQGVEFRQMGLGFVPKPGSPEFARHRSKAQEACAIALQWAQEENDGLLVLDEICTAFSSGLLEEQQVLDLMKECRTARLVLTGRGASPAMLAAADTATEMRSIKHAMSAGLPAQRGVEF